MKTLSWSPPLSGAGRHGAGTSAVLTILATCLVLSFVGGFASGVEPLLAMALIAVTVLAGALVWLKFYLPLAVLAVGGTVDILVRFEMGPVSLMGMITVIVAFGSWYAWLLRPRGRSVSLPAMPMWALYLLWSGASLLLFPLTIEGIQNYLVFIGFIGIMMLSAVGVVMHPSLQETTGRLIKISAWCAAFLFLLKPFFQAIDARMAIENRSFALFALFGIAWFLAESQYNQRRALWLALALALLVALSLSRTATAIALVMFALSRFDPSRVRGWVTFMGSGAVAATIGYIAVTRVDAIRSRFTEGDTSIQVGGIAINGEGRIGMWTITLDSFSTSPWLGQGSGSASRAVAAKFDGAIHPHNDYLRILHDFGLLGFSIWLICQVALVSALVRVWLRYHRAKDDKGRYILAALLSLAGFFAAMFTDNVITYSFVMLPLGVIVGTALGVAVAESQSHNADDRAPDPVAPYRAPNDRLATR